MPSAARRWRLGASPCPPAGSSRRLRPLLILIALFSPIGTIADELVWMHMIEHLLIGDLGALFIVIGLTGPVLQPLLALRGLRWMRSAALPWIALPLWAIDLVIWHLAPLYDKVITDPALHAAQHVCFLAFGILMWMPVARTAAEAVLVAERTPLAYVVIVRLFQPHSATSSSGPGRSSTAPTHRARPHTGFRR